MSQRSTFIAARELAARHEDLPDPARHAGLSSLWICKGTARVDDPRKYIRIAGGIREEIKAGKRQASDLVSITYLTQEHDVARQTAAKALGMLAREGLLKRFPGIGYVVTDYDTDA